MGERPAVVLGTTPLFSIAISDDDVDETEDEDVDTDEVILDVHDLPTGSHRIARSR